MKRTTIKDIATMCGVSPSTVSRAINNTDEISQATRAKILTAIEETGYIPSQNARNLKVHKNKTIAVIVKGVTNPFFTPMLNVLEEEITKTHYTFSLHKVEENRCELEVAQRVVENVKPEGIIFLGGYHIEDPRKLHRLGVPFSMTTTINRDLEIDHSTCVGVDDYAESKKMIEYLINLGHRKIAFIAARSDDESIGRLRLEGYRSALKEHGIDYDERLVIYPTTDLNPYSLHHGYQSASKIIKEQIDCTAIFAISDFVAIGAIKAIDDHGYRVPEDYSVAGFDGLEINEFLLKPITTIIQPSAKIAYQSVVDLFHIINNEVYPKMSEFEGELYIGATTQPLENG